MCDYDSDESSLHLYDIPEFPGYNQVQANTEVNSSTQRVDLYSSESLGFGTTSSRTDFIEDDSVGVASTRDYSTEEYLSNRGSTGDHSPKEDPTNDSSFGEDQSKKATSQHVTTVSTTQPVQTHERPQVLGTILNTSSRLNHSVAKVWAKARRDEQQALLKNIVANPRLRTDRASALRRLQEKAVAIKIGSAQEGFHIFELAILAKEVAPKTEKTAEELFHQYHRLAKRQEAKSVSQKRASENLVQTPNINIGNVEVPKEEVQLANPIIAAKQTIKNQAIKRARRSLAKLRLAVSCGYSIPVSQITALRERVRLVAQKSGTTPEVELAKLNLSRYKRARSLSLRDSGDSISSQVYKLIFPG